MSGPLLNLRAYTFPPKFEVKPEVNKEKKNKCRIKCCNFNSPIIFVNADPVSTDGFAIGTVAINKNTGAVFQLTAAGWVFQENITGSPGPSGPSGQRGSLIFFQPFNPIPILAPSPEVNTVVYQNNDVIINTVTFDVFTFMNGFWIFEGNLKGANGTPGSQIFFNAVDPTGTNFNQGDTWINTTTFNVFSFQSGAWVLEGNIRGPPGANGTPGSQIFFHTTDPVGTNFNQGDTWINTTTFNVFSFQSGAWVLEGNTQGPPGPSSLFINNSVFVDVNFGTAAGQRENLASPFQTIAQALAVALSGDTIYVQPGTYTADNITLKNNVNFYMSEGVTINNTSNPMFNDNFGSVNINILGYANYTSNSNILLLNNNSNVNISGLTCTSTGTVPMFSISNNRTVVTSFIIEFDSFTCQNTSSVIYINALTDIYIKADYITSNHSIAFCDVNTGTTTSSILSLDVKNITIRSSNTNIFTSNAQFVNIYLYVETFNVTTTGNIFASSSSTQTFIFCDIDLLNASSGLINATSTTNAFLNIKDGTISNTTTIINLNGDNFYLSFETLSLTGVSAPIINVNGSTNFTMKGSSITVTNGTNNYFYTSNVTGTVTSYLDFSTAYMKCPFLDILSALSMYVACNNLQIDTTNTASILNIISLTGAVAFNLNVKTLFLNNLGGAHCVFFTSNSNNENSVLNLEDVIITGTYQNLINCSNNTLATIVNIISINNVTFDVMFQTNCLTYIDIRNAFITCNTSFITTSTQVVYFTSDQLLLECPNFLFQMTGNAEIYGIVNQFLLFQSSSMSQHSTSVLSLFCNILHFAGSNTLPLLDMNNNDMTATYINAGMLDIRSYNTALSVSTGSLIIDVGFLNAPFGLGTLINVNKTSSSSLFAPVSINATNLFCTTTAVPFIVQQGLLTVNVGTFVSTITTTPCFRATGSGSLEAYINRLTSGSTILDTSSSGYVMFKCQSNVMTGTADCFTIEAPNNTVNCTFGGYFVTASANVFNLTGSFFPVLRILGSTLVSATNSIDNATTVVNPNVIVQSSISNHNPVNVTVIPTGALLVNAGVS